MPRILIVEDNDLNSDMLARRLQLEGFETMIAIDGPDGIEVARRDPPDVILMDMSMPIMDGWQATRALKADPATRDIPVIGVSAHALDGDREKALASGCDEYEHKPIDFEALLKKIASLIKGHPGI
jgi:two-component system, cell cycle response regulator DivK